jgi:hypothetical protein
MYTQLRPSEPRAPEERAADAPEQKEQAAAGAQEDQLQQRVLAR